MGSLRDRFVSVENKVHGVLVRHGITALRLTVGAVFFGFGVLKFFPEVSPAQDLAVRTIDLLSFGLVPWQIGIVALAMLECFIGLCLLANRWMRVAVWLLAVQLIGVLAPIVLLTGRLFSGPHHAPTLEGQYVLKDIILVAAGMVIAAGSFRGGRLIRDEPHSNASSTQPPQAHDGSRKLEIVINAIGTSQPSTTSAPNTRSHRPPTTNGEPPSYTRRRAPQPDRTSDVATAPTADPVSSRPDVIDSPDQRALRAPR